MSEIDELYLCPKILKNYIMSTKRIIESLLDVDRYKLTMMQFIFFFFPNIRVKYRFKNRTNTPEVNKIMEHLRLFIDMELRHVQTLRFSYSELQYLSKTGIFKEEFLNHLSLLRLDNVTVDIVDGELFIEYEGLWSHQILWETIILSVVNELYSRVVALRKYGKDNNLSDSEFYSLFPLVLNGDEEFLNKIVAPYEEEAMRRLEVKIQEIKHHSSVKFFEFGTRRRFSRLLQEKIIQRLNEAFHKSQFLGASQFMGTSNEYMGFKHGLKVGGTMAHEMFMGIAALNRDNDDKLINSTWDFLRQWNKFYGYDLSVALTDTFGSDWFFKNCPEDIAHMISPREDSAIDLYKYKEEVIKLYRKYNINTHEKVIVHSNGLKVPKVVAIENYQHDEINTVYGIGTDFSCDVGFDYPHISIVIKLASVYVDKMKQWVDTVKLSDNLAKAIGPKEEVEYYKGLFGYTVKESVAQEY